MNISNVLSTGQPIWGWGRAADLISFQIGKERTVTDRHGLPKTVGEFALHIQCPWRVTQNEKLLVGSGDLHYGPDGNPLLNFDSARMGSTRCDVLLDRLFQASGALRISTASMNGAGLLKLDLTGDICVEVFPETSADHEHWRIFAPYTGRPHMIAKGVGIREESQKSGTDGTDPIPDT